MRTLRARAFRGGIGPLGEPLMRTASVLIGLIVTVLSAMPASADIVAVGGAAVVAEPPSSIALDQWQSDTEVRGFFERQTTLSSNLTLDHVNVGFVEDLSELVSGVVPSGTTVQSYLFHADPLTTGLLSGYVIFDTPVLGVEVQSFSLMGTDGRLGRPGVTYGTNSSRRLELSSTSLDTFEISADRLRVDFTMQVDDADDEIRIVTAVPEPGALSLLAFGGMLSMRRRRGSR